MVHFMYRWRIPPKEREDFPNDWKDLTRLAKGYGALSVTLYCSENGDFVAMATWPSTEKWRLWKEELKDHPARQKYRDYRVSGPELLMPVVTIDEKSG